MMLSLHANSASSAVSAELCRFSRMSLYKITSFVRLRHDGCSRLVASAAKNLDTCATHLPPPRGRTTESHELAKVLAAPATQRRYRREKAVNVLLPTPVSKLYGNKSHPRSAPTLELRSDKTKSPNENHSKKTKRE